MKILKISRNTEYDISLKTKKCDGHALNVTVQSVFTIENVILVMRLFVWNNATC